MHGRGAMCGKGACMVEGVGLGHVWQGGMCDGEGMCGRGHAWQGGMCGGGHAWQGHAWQGGMHGGVCVWQGVYMAEEACMVGGIHATHAPLADTTAMVDGQ